MTKNSPRIYTYKITFEEVPYYYYGVKKEKSFNEEYWGSPKTNKWYWELYTPKKQILQFFDFTDEGWLEAQEIEKRLIKPFYDTDKWCLNESCGGIFSLEILRKTGRKSGLKHKENSTGIFGMTPEEKYERNKKVGLKHKENGTGIFSITPEERSEISRRCGLKIKENGTGIFAKTPEERSEHSRKIGLKNKENGTGVCGMTTEELREIGRRGGLKNKENGTGIFGMTAEERSKHSRKVALQQWECLETGFVTNAGCLSRYQKARGIDTSKRERIS
jgi:ethanolamine utilization microcompartment shell protein EutS